MADLKYPNWAQNQQIITNDLNKIKDGFDDSIGEILKAYISGAADRVLQGLLVQEVSTPKNAIKITAGAAIQGRDNNGKICLLQSDINDSSTLTPSIIFPSKVTNPRYDILQIQFGIEAITSQSRNFIDPSNGNVSSAATNTEEKTVMIVSRKQGTESATPIAPTVDSGYLKLAEVYVDESGAVIINTSDIKDYTQASSWTNEANLTKGLTTFASHVMNSPIEHPDGSITGAKLGTAAVVKGKLNYGRSIISNLSAQNLGAIAAHVFGTNTFNIANWDTMIPANSELLFVDFTLKCNDKQISLTVDSWSAGIGSNFIVIYHWINASDTGATGVIVTLGIQALWLEP